MELNIFSMEGAIDYVSSKLTYAIRIMSSYDNGKLFEKFSLKDSFLYLNINEYIFDDVFPDNCEGKILINRDISLNILQNFSKYRDKCDSLLVHCMVGKNRSPAVAIALNEIFNLGNDSELLKKKYTDENLGYEFYNTFVYDSLIRVAKESGLITT